MSTIDYRALSDTDKLGLLQLLYQKANKEQRKIIVAETQIVYNRLRMRSN